MTSEAHGTQLSADDASRRAPAAFGPTTPFAATCCAAVVFLVACGDVKQTGPAKACTKEYEQCVLPTGVLGVCNPVDCAEGQPAPCLVCRSQH